MAKSDLGQSHETLLELDFIESYLLESEEAQVRLRLELKQSQESSRGNRIKMILDVLEIFDVLACSEGQDLSSREKKILRRMKRHLDEWGVVETKCERLDPNFMKVVETRWDSEKESNAVLEVLRSGYQLGDSVIRLAEVVTNRAPS